MKLLLAVLLCVPMLAQAQRALPVVELGLGMYRIEAEVAANDLARQTGLMHRSSLPPQRGMLFVYDYEMRHCMWMRNTLIPLSVAFLDTRGAIINIEDMQPQSDDTHCATKPAAYSLEMNLGWFRSRGFGPGAVVTGIPGVRGGAR